VSYDILEFVDERLKDFKATPHMFGNASELELQGLILFEFIVFAFDPRKARTRYMLDTYQKFRARSHPRCPGSQQLADFFVQHFGEEEAPVMIADFLWSFRGTLIQLLSDAEAERKLR